MSEPVIWGVVLTGVLFGWFFLFMFLEWKIKRRKQRQRRAKLLFPPSMRSHIKYNESIALKYINGDIDILEYEKLIIFK